MNANTTNTIENATATLTRANKLTIKTLSDGSMQADFYRTHKHILTVQQKDTAFNPDPKANKTLTREMFRQHMADNAEFYGVNFDQEDRRTVDNIRNAKYESDSAVLVDAEMMVMGDIDRFYSKLPELLKVNVSTCKATMDSLTPKTTTSKGTDLSTMGIENGKYVNSGNWAWADIEGTVTLVTVKEEEIYVPLALELVSGQLKKFRMTQTQFNDAVKQGLLEIGYTNLEPEKKAKAKAEKSAKAETPADVVEKAESKANSKYEVTYGVKAGKKRGEEEIRTMTVEAANAKEACAIVKKFVKDTDGVNAFHPTAKKVEG